MERYVKVPISSTDVGFAFAHGSDNEQGDLINNLGRELFVYCKGDHDFDGQLCYISNKLDKNGIKFIHRLEEFIKLREESAPKE